MIRGCLGVSNWDGDQATAGGGVKRLHKLTAAAWSDLGLVGQELACRPFKKRGSALSLRLAPVDFSAGRAA